MMISKYAIFPIAVVTAAIDFGGQIPLQPAEHSQGYHFDPLIHLPGTSPYFDAVGFGLRHQAPEGCTVNAASYLIRHGAIYCNDDEYEDFIKPFLRKLERHRGDFTGPLAFLNKWQSPIDEDHLEDVTPSGKIDSEKVGRHLATRYEHLISTVSRLVADTKSRTYDTATSFIKAFPNKTDIEIVRFDKKDLNDGTRATLPHKACSRFSKSHGEDEQYAFLGVYAPLVSQRLSKYTPDDYDFSSKDILALQSLCGYESAIKGERSPICPIFTDAEWMAYEYAWDMKYAYMVGPLNNLSTFLGMPWLTAQSRIFEEIDGDTEAASLLPSFFSDIESQAQPDAGWPRDQRFFLYFTHREVPPVIATALGLFNSSAQCGYDEFPTTHINWARAWKMADLIPFLGHVGMEHMVCERPVAERDRQGKEAVHKRQYIRFIANTAPRPLPLCQSGPGASCPFDEFQEILAAGNEKFGDFDGVCGNK